MHANLYIEFEVAWHKRSASITAHLAWKFVIRAPFETLVWEAEKGVRTIHIYCVHNLSGQCWRAKLCRTYRRSSNRDCQPLLFCSSLSWPNVMHQRFGKPHTLSYTHCQHPHKLHLDFHNLKFFNFSQWWLSFFHILSSIKQVAP